MADQEIQTLINTLMQGGLASSEGEARRMAEDMLGTTAKVQDEYAAKKAKLNMFANEVTAKGGPSTQVTDQAPDQVPQMETPKPQVSEHRTQNTDIPPRPIQNSAAMQSKIEELRNAALNPEPVNIQVDFQTPKTDRLLPENTEPVQIQAEYQPPVPKKTPQNADFAPQFSPEQVEKATKNTAGMSVDFNIPGIDNNLTINELSSGAPKPAPQPSNNGDFFGQQQQSQPQQNTQQNSQNANVAQKPAETKPAQLNNGFPQNNVQQKRDPFEVRQSAPRNNAPEAKSENSQTVPNRQAAPSDFLQMKQPEPAPVNNQHQAEHSSPNPSIPANNQQPAEQKTEDAKPKRESRWTEEEKKLKDQVDLSKIFNFSNN